MMIAKLEPGAFNVPYVASCNTVPVAGLNFEVARTQTKIHSDTAMTDIGKDVAMLIAYCPAFSVSNANNSNVKMSGYISESRTDLTGPALDATWFSNLGIQSIGMEDLYGSDGKNFSNGNFVWAGEIQCAFTIPAANVSGVIYEGTIQYRQLFDSVGSPKSLSFE